MHYSDAFDYEFGVGVLRTPERLYKEEEDLLEDDNLPQEDENNYDGKKITLSFLLCQSAGLINFFWNL